MRWVESLVALTARYWHPTPGSYLRTCGGQRAAISQCWGEREVWENERMTPQEYRHYSRFPFQKSYGGITDREVLAGMHGDSRARPFGAEGAHERTIGY